MFLCDTAINYSNSSNTILYICGNLIYIGMLTGVPSPVLKTVMKVLEGIAGATVQMLASSSSLPETFVAPQNLVGYLQPCARAAWCHLLHRPVKPIQNASRSVRAADSEHQELARLPPM